MSYAAERWARSQTVGNSTAKAVLRELAFYHNGQTGLCCPSVSKIARVLEVKKADTITAAIKRLEEGGFISREFIRDPETGQILRTEYALIGFVASEWVSSKNQGTSPEDQGTSPEDQGTSPENRGTVPQKRGRGSPEKGGEGSPKNRDVTGNKNKEEEQKRDTHSDAPVEGDLFNDDVKEIKTPKRPKTPPTLCPFKDGDQIPPQYLEYVKRKRPDIDAQTEFEKFFNYHAGQGNKKSDWLAAWRYWVGNIKTYSRQTQRSTNIRFEGHDNDFSCIYG